MSMIGSKLGASARQAIAKSVRATVTEGARHAAGRGARSAVASGARRTAATTGTKTARPVVRELLGAARALAREVDRAIERGAPWEALSQATERAFRKAAKVAAGPGPATQRKLGEAIRIARIANRLPGAGNADVLILDDARRRFKDFASKGALAAAAGDIADFSRQRALVNEMAKAAKSGAEHVQVAMLALKVGGPGNALAPAILLDGIARASSEADVRAIRQAAPKVRKRWLDDHPNLFDRL